METIAMCNYQKPTLIQACSWPILLSGLDLIGIALTGSGKTLAFVLPAIIHASHQEFVRPTEGPIVLIMAPTRELVQQISTVAHQYGQLAQCRTTVIFGGASKEPQRQALVNGMKIITRYERKTTNKCKFASRC
jgi:ATP-dependent RNA helicase DDX5/DBP2